MLEAVEVDNYKMHMGRTHNLKRTILPWEWAWSLSPAPARSCAGQSGPRRWSSWLQYQDDQIVQSGRFCAGMSPPSLESRSWSQHSLPARQCLEWRDLEATHTKSRLIFFWVKQGSQITQDIIESYQSTPGFCTVLHGSHGTPCCGALVPSWHECSSSSSPVLWSSWPEVQLVVWNCRK